MAQSKEQRAQEISERSLGTCTLEEIVEHLNSRYDAGVIACSCREENVGIVNTSFVFGSIAHCVGLARLLSIRSESDLMEETYISPESLELDEDDENDEASGS